MITEIDYDKNAVYVKHELLHVESYFKNGSSNKHCFKPESIAYINKEVDKLTIATVDGGEVGIQLKNEELAEESYQEILRLIGRITFTIAQENGEHKNLGRFMTGDDNACLRAFLDATQPKQQGE